MHVVKARLSYIDACLSWLVPYKIMDFAYLCAAKPKLCALNLKYAD